MTAIKAMFADFKLVKTRQVAQLIFEVPIEAADNALHALGGVPRPDAERWVGIAPITEKAAQRAATPTTQPKSPIDDLNAAAEKAEKPKRRMAELSRAQQAGILCNEREFHLFIAEKEFILVEDMDDGICAEAVREYCGVDSRAKLDGAAGNRWDELRTEYDAWRGAIGRPE